MNRPTWRSQRVPTVALLLLALVITTGWTQPAAPMAIDGQSSGIGARPADGIAVAPGAALARQLLSIAAARESAILVAHRASNAAMAISARALYQVRVIASRAAEPTPVRVKSPATAVAKSVAKAPVAKSAATTYRGTNHFWFPALGISRSVYSFPCSRTRDPDNYLYRWGCAGTNNVYLMGHAATVLRSLHDTYLAGRLRVGMVAYYADSSGRVRKYKVTTWRLLSPTSATWAIASQPVPSMTLQTCIGLKRLAVRLVAVN
ncbi:MAG: hypothetical protein ABI620_01665 [Chloroflexota bacterium]